MTWFEHFVNKANNVHQNKFDYSKFEYVSAKLPGIIICPIEGHGEFLQSPDHHTHTGARGCPKCAMISRLQIMKGYVGTGLFKGPPTLLKEVYERMLYDKYGDKFKFDTSKYIGRTKGSVTILCKEHGEEVHSPNHLLISKYGCSKCAQKGTADFKVKSYDQLLFDVEKVHGAKYTLLEENRNTFKNRKSMVKVLCPEHGVFEKRAQKLLSGQGCFRCKMDELIEEGKLPGGYGETIFRDNPELAKSEATLYYLSINSSKYKIGITVCPVKQRMAAIKSISKGYIKELVLVKEVRTSLENAFRIEQQILERYKDTRILRRWSTELFDKDVLEGVELSSFLNEMHTHTNTAPETPSVSP